MLQKALRQQERAYSSKARAERLSACPADALAPRSTPLVQIVVSLTLGQRPCLFSLSVFGCLPRRILLLPPLGVLAGGISFPRKDGDSLNTVCAGRG